VLKQRNFMRYNVFTEVKVDIVIFWVFYVM